MELKKSIIIMTILSKCIEKDRIKDVYDGDEIEIWKI